MQKDQRAGVLPVPHRHGVSVGTALLARSPLMATTASSSPSSSQPALTPTNSSLLRPTPSHTPFPFLPSPTILRTLSKHPTPIPTRSKPILTARAPMGNLLTRPIPIVLLILAHRHHLAHDILADPPHGLREVQRAWILVVEEGVEEVVAAACVCIINSVARR